ncbi:outer membrane beta-barrel protein [Tenacibaculum sp. nBUS_03]|uniref:outer membrane beta-barrel protein n=1 Tax=Tenacibaculum sp. nBUS_03 TaxID=3395320 RepID=UPI003EBBCDC5
MNDRKNIDRIFEEKLNGFEASPNPEMWDTIEAKLKKKKRRVLPMWWLYSGIAAVFILGFVLYPFFKHNSSLEPIIKQHETIVNTPNDFNKHKKEIDSNIPVKTENSNTFFTKEKNTIVAENKKNTTKITPTKTHTDTKLIASKKMGSDKIVEGVLSDKKRAMEKTFITKKEKKSVKNDSLKKLFTKKDFLAEISKKDSVLTVKTSKDKWSVSPVFALTHANSLTQSSALDKSLKSANLSGDNNLSYGIKVAYQLNNKWSIQSGVFTQKVGFTNKNLSVMANVRGASLESLELTSSPLLILNPSNSAPDVDTLSSANIVSSEASLNQTYSYIEVPVELKYAIFNNRKFNTKIVTGFSSLFLNQNEVTVTSEKTSQTIGKASNLNSLNFSGNLGLDLEYSINKKLKFVVNPMFKIHLNTYSKNSNGFKPYTLGVYSGISYQF